jgi:hypothetical protein
MINDTDNTSKSDQRYWGCAHQETWLKLKLHYAGVNFQHSRQTSKLCDAQFKAKGGSSCYRERGLRAGCNVTREEALVSCPTRDYTRLGGGGGVLEGRASLSGHVQQ